MEYQLSNGFLPWRQDPPQSLNPPQFAKTHANCFFPLIHNIPDVWLRKAALLVDFFAGDGKFHQYRNVLPNLDPHDYDHEFGKVWWFPVFDAVVKNKTYVEKKDMPRYKENCSWKCTRCGIIHHVRLAVVVFIALNLCSERGWNSYVHGKFHLNVPSNVLTSEGNFQVSHLHDIRADCNPLRLVLEDGDSNGRRRKCHGHLNRSADTQQLSCSVPDHVPACALPPPAFTGSWRREISRQVEEALSDTARAARYRKEWLKLRSKPVRI